jgi:hypothetical protein
VGFDLWERGGEEKGGGGEERGGGGEEKGGEDEYIVLELASGA